MTARWLNDSQRAYANRRPQANQKTFKSKIWKKDQFIEAVIDPKTWLLFFYTTLICIPNGGITNVSFQIFGRSTAIDTFPLVQFYHHQGIRL